MLAGVWFTNYFGIRESLLWVEGLVWWMQTKSALCICLGQSVVSGPMTISRSCVSKASKLPHRGGSWIPADPYLLVAQNQDFVRKG